MQKPFKLYNRNSGALVGSYSTRSRARAALDKKDNAYGAYIHFIKEEK